MRATRRAKESRPVVSKATWARARKLALKSAEEMTDEEDAAITKAALSDPDNPPLDAAWFAKARPAAEVFPEIVADYLKRRGRPKAAETKVPVTLRLDRDVVKALKSSGRGWQTRVNAMLKRWTKRGGKAA